MGQYYPTNKWVRIPTELLVSSLDSQGYERVPTAMIFHHRRVGGVSYGVQCSMWAVLCSGIYTIAGPAPGWSVLTNKLDPNGIFSGTRYYNQDSGQGIGKRR